MKIDLSNIASFCLIGQKDNQEDYFAPNESVEVASPMFILCDGMGGHEHGELASHTVVDSFVEWFKQHPLKNNEITDDDFNAALNYAFSALDSRDDGALRKMGTTLVFLYFGSNCVMAAHIGDSKIFQIRPGKGIIYESRDHSLVQQLVDLGEITQEQARTHPRKNIITRCMSPGKENRCEADIAHIVDVCKGDYFILCSDGALENVSVNQLSEIICTPSYSMDEKLRLWKYACGNNYDNYSAMIIPVDNVETYGIDNDASIMPLPEGTPLNSHKYTVAKYVGEDNGAITYVGVKGGGQEIVGIREYCDKSLYLRGSHNRLLPKHPTLNPDEVKLSHERFETEYCSIEAKDPTHRLKVIDAFSENGTQYYVFCFAKGSSLQDIFELKGRFASGVIPKADKPKHEEYPLKDFLKILAIIIGMLVIVVGTWMYAQHYHELHDPEPVVVQK